MGISLVSFPPPTPYHTLYSQRLSDNTSAWLFTSPRSCTPLSSTSNSIVQDDALPVQQESAAVDVVADLPVGGCKACGRQEIEKGCNGEGRIQGGIATVPGFGWWPIKAYRPCPGLVASGGRYRRQGQSMDEVAFGRGKKESSTEVESM